MHDTIANTRNTCYLINKQSYPSVFDDSISHSGFNVLNADYQYNHNPMEASESVYYDVGANSDSSDYSSLLDGNSEDSISVVLNMLQSYVRGNTISSAMYEANVVKKILSNIIQSVYNANRLWYHNTRTCARFGQISESLLGSSEYFIQRRRLNNG